MISTRRKRECRVKSAEMESTRVRSTDNGTDCRRALECGGRCTGLGCPGWWRAVPKEERALLWSLVRMLESAKRSRVVGVVRAARKWESSLSCFMKVRLLSKCRMQNAKC